MDSSHQGQEFPNLSPRLFSAVSTSIALFDSLGYNAAVGTLRGYYSELYVAKKLMRFGAQIGKSRDVKKSDVYLPELRKSIEVKATGMPIGDATYEWQLTRRQGKQRPFDYLVLLAYDYEAPLQLRKEFVVERSEIPSFVDKSFGTKFGISFWEESDRAHLPQDSLLSEHPERFESRWDKISK